MSIEEITAIVTSTVTIASIIAAITPTPKDDNLIRNIYKIIDLLAINVGKAKDK